MLEIGLLSRIKEGRSKRRFMGAVKKEMFIIGETERNVEDRMLRNVAEKERKIKQKIYEYSEKYVYNGCD